MLSHIRRTLPLLSRHSAVCTFERINHPARSSSSFSDLITASDGLVLRSESTDVFQNLALEDWIDANVDLQQRCILLLWRNQPSVVIGRHQNPWTECNLPALRRAGITLARRRSGGGTVYHDLGNLNLTFFTSKKGYDRKRNLKVVTDALKRIRPQLNVQATERFDILLNGHLKISGSASRLSRKSSYHHCTLLHSADRSALSAVLRPSCPGIISNATPSVPSPVANLVDHAPTLQWEELLEALGQQYNTEFGFRAPLALVNPSDEAEFPGLSRMEAELQTWDWTFGKTPKFSVKTALDLTDTHSAHSSAQLCMEVKNGVIEGCDLHVNTDWLPPRLSGELSGVLVGERFCGHRAAAAVTALLRSECGELQDRLINLCDAMVSVMGAPLI
ncbi:lipoyltransferase 1, mitochondrial [Cheilinus undulatus]|uniref:lipoyltransferase 1, mitochondrial n=1 Tax=Cheilinus undulatus TaxID=241271 RepID=UPI001BD3BE11|nr:lipoyltransferase 1, mitochondrial [Cheilinus undulatus]XP_041638055.1 lipoyltransferase 1, mitochondrial [Cheilinus undulatus]